MTIKQQGGIFGRNPTFNETTSTTSNTDALYVTDKAGINATSSQIPALTRFQIGSVGSGSDATYSGRLKLDDQPTSLQQGGGLEFMTSTFGSGYGWKMSSISSSGVHLVIGTRQNSADWTEVARFNSSGNLAFPSGQGIDFSATSGTGTSELFSDYEEGSWTPQFSVASGTLTTNASFSGGKYTKIGNTVTVWAKVRVGTRTSPSGAVDVTGLPYTSASVGATDPSQGIAITVGEWNTSTSGVILARTESNSTTVSLLREAGSGRVDDAGTYMPAVGDYVYFSVTYRAA